MSRACSVVGCEKPHQGRGFCAAHLRRWQRHGDPLKGAAFHGSSLRERFERRVVRSDGCWEWAGGHTGLGYAQMWFQGKKLYVHRVAYELFVGPIPDGLEPDHRCRNTGCVNPAHLEPVTHRENIQRAYRAVVA